MLVKQLAVLEERHREPEPELQLSKAGRCGSEARIGDVSGRKARAEPVRLPVEERGSHAERKPLDIGEQLLGLVTIADRERGLDPVHVGVLDRLIRDSDSPLAGGRPFGCDDGLGEPTLGAPHCRLGGRVASTVLHVGRCREPFVDREDSPRPVQLTTVELELEHRVQRTDQRPAGRELLLGDLREHRDGFVPASEHVERVGHFAECEPFVRAAPILPGERQGLLEIPERFLVSVSLEGEVGEICGRHAGSLGEVVLEGVLEREAVQPSSLFRTSVRDGEHGLDIPGCGERLGNRVRLADLEGSLDVIGRLLLASGEPVLVGESSSEQGEILSGVVCGDHGIGPFHALDRFVRLPHVSQSPPEPRQDAGGRVRLTFALVEGNGGLVQSGCGLQRAGPERHVACAVG
jgi:hypothetical protein